MKIFNGKILVLFAVVLLGFVYISASNTAKLDSMHEDNQENYYASNLK